MLTAPVGIQKYESAPPKLLKVPVTEYSQFCDLHTANELASMMNKMTGIKVVVEINTALSALYNFPSTNSNINIYSIVGQYRGPDGVVSDINEVAGSLWDRKTDPSLTLDKNFDGTVGGKLLVVTDVNGKAVFKWGDGKSQAASKAAVQPTPVGSVPVGTVGVMTGIPTGVPSGV